jgi:hypothetical protein
MYELVFNKDYLILVLINTWLLHDVNKALYGTVPVPYRTVWYGINGTLRPYGTC